MRDPFLIDECLSPDLVALAHERGFDATHVVFHGLAGTSDRDLLPVIRHEGFAFVTSNAKDFLKLYAREECPCRSHYHRPGGNSGGHPTASVLPSPRRREDDAGSGQSDCRGFFRRIGRNAGLADRNMNTIRWRMSDRRTGSPLCEE